MTNFKVGDIVKPNEKADFKYGITNRKHMKEGVVTEVSPHGALDVRITKWVKDAGLIDKYWAIDPACFDLVRRGGVLTELHITGDGKTVHAVLKENEKVVKRAKAVCSPEDEYSFETGARLAIDRVFGKDEKNAEEKGAAYEPKFKFEIGDVVKVVDGGETYSLYDEFMKQYGDDYLMRWGYGSEPDEMFAYKVVQRGIGLGNTLYVIERQGECGKPLYIISEDRLKKAW